MTEEQKAIVDELKTRGLNSRDIAEQVGVKVKSVAGYLGGKQKAARRRKAEEEVKEEAQVMPEIRAEVRENRAEVCERRAEVREESIFTADILKLLGKAIDIMAELVSRQANGEGR